MGVLFIIWWGFIVEYWVVDEVAEEFVREVGYGRSVDWYLIKLGSAIYRLESACYGDVEVCVREFLNKPEVRGALAPLACYRDAVRELILTPRHRGLQPYMDLILEILSSLKCSGRERIESIMRKETYAVESGKEKEEIRKEVVVEERRWRRSKLESVSRRSSSLKSFAILAILLMVSATLAYFIVETGLLKEVAPTVLEKPTAPTSTIYTEASTTSATMRYSSITPSPTMPTSTTTQSSPLIASKSESINVTEPVIYALNRINYEREKYGLEPLKLFHNNTVAQQHAEEMVTYGYLSHWDINGYKPYMRWGFEGYTWFGISESIGAMFIYDGKTWSSWELKEAIDNSVYNMVYNDAESNWGHRDDLLDPCHNYVAIGIAYSSKMFALVINSINDYIVWLEKPRILGSKLQMSGIIPYRFIDGNDSVPISIYVFYDKPPKKTTAYQLNNEFPSSYGYGETNSPIAGVLPKTNMYYEDIETLYAEEYIVENRDNGLFFKVTVDLKPILTKDGVYTIIILQKDLKQKHPFRELNYCELTNIVIKYVNGTIMYFTKN